MDSPVQFRVVAMTALIILFVFLLSPQFSAVYASEKANRSSSSGIFWATAKDEGDLLRKSEAEESPASEYDEFEGGFSSLDGMLQWAIGNSDPVKLKEKAQDVQQLSKSELAKRQAELKELMEKLKMPSDAELMQIAIADLNNSSLSLEDRHRALHELLVLVEPIDNANGTSNWTMLYFGKITVLCFIENDDSFYKASFSV